MPFVASLASLLLLPGVHYRDVKLLMPPDLFGVWGNGRTTGTTPPPLPSVIFTDRKHLWTQQGLLGGDELGGGVEYPVDKLHLIVTADLMNGTL
ncbi:hypothetical protein XELAEV_18035966mg [Xenopus laevis]|uniref:Uncharacterized protein n=1 Tax=Xenopus laevis TaxID=8355 RepID=A0A974CHC3_XENLA|nr:hypothetical protein XELAEV_18035966mg [Xenopus laevis]